MVSHLGILALLISRKVVSLEEPLHAMCNKYFKVSYIKSSYNHVYICGYIKRKEINKTGGYVSVLIFIPNCYNIKHENFKDTEILKIYSFLSHNETTSKRS